MVGSYWRLSLDKSLFSVLYADDPSIPPPATHHKVGTLVIPDFQMKKLRHREAVHFVWGDTAGSHVGFEPRQAGPRSLASTITCPASLEENILIQHLK